MINKFNNKKKRKKLKEIREMRLSKGNQPILGRLRQKKETSLGPLEIPKDNIVIQGNKEEGIYATGHNSVVKVPKKDEWYIVYHRFSYPTGINMGDAAGFHREVAIDKLEFNTDGTIKQVVSTHAGINPVKKN